MWKDLKLQKAHMAWGVYGVPNERGEQLCKEFIKIINNLLKPKENGNIEFGDIDIIKPFLELAQDEKEFAFCAHAAGYELRRLHVQFAQFERGLKEN